MGINFDAFAADQANIENIQARMTKDREGKRAVEAVASAGARGTAPYEHLPQTHEGSMHRFELQRQQVHHESIGGREGDGAALVQRFQRRGRSPGPRTRGQRGRSPFIPPGAADSQRRGRQDVRGTTEGYAEQRM